MKTTVPIDEDILDKLQQKAEEQGISLKTLINILLENCLNTQMKPKNIKPYICKVYSLGMPEQINLDHTLKIIDLLEELEVQEKLNLNT